MCGYHINVLNFQEEQVSAVDNELPFSVTAGNKSVRCDDTEMKQGKWRETNLLILLKNPHTGTVQGI